MSEIVKKQIVAIRNTGFINMFDLNAVKLLAIECSFSELVILIESDSAAYIRFILTGEEE